MSTLTNRTTDRASDRGRGHEGPSLDDWRLAVAVALVGIIVGLALVMLFLG